MALGTSILRRSFLAATILGCSLGWQSAVAQTPQKVYRVGVVPQFDVRTLTAIWSPIVAELQTRTGLQFELVGSSSIPQFEAQFAREEFDFVYMNPYHAVVAMGRYVPLVRDVQTDLQGVVVVRRDSAFKSLPELQGKRVDFPAPNALAASLMVRAQLAHEKITVDARYVNTHKSVYLNVALGQADAGGGVQQTLDEQPAEVRDALRVIYKTVAVPSHPVMASSRLPQAVRNQVQSALLAMGDSDAAHALLRKIPIDKVGKATVEDYNLVKRMDLERFYVRN